MVKYSQYSELYHFGIKGQKWGVRRYQNADGSLTPEGYRHYGVTPEKIQREKERAYRTYVYNNYGNVKVSKKKFMEESSKKEGQLAAQMVKRKQAMKIGAAIGIGVGLTIAGAYMYKTYGSSFFDQTIRKGSTLQTLSMNDKRFTNAKNTGSIIYTAFTKRDKDNYKALFGQQLGSLGVPMGNKFNIKIKAEDKIKIASRKSARKVFNDLYNNDPKFKNAVTVLHPDSAFNVGPKKGGLDLYKKFNIGLVTAEKDFQRQPLAQKFYDELKKRGYSGLVDENDVSAGFLNIERRGNKWQTAAPAIMFDFNNLKQISSNKLTDKEIKRADSMQDIRAFISRPENVAALATTPIGAAGITISLKENSSAQKIANGAKKKKEKK